MFPGQSHLQYPLCPGGELFTEYPCRERGGVVNIHSPARIYIPPNGLAMFLACNHELRLLVTIADKEFTGVFPCGTFGATKARIPGTTFRHPSG